MAMLRAVAARTVPAAAAVTVAALQEHSWPYGARTFGGAKLTAEQRMCGAQQPRICGKRKPQVRRSRVGPTCREARRGARLTVNAPLSCQAMAV